MKPGVSLQRLTEQVKPIEQVLLSEPTTDFAVAIIGMNMVIGVQTTNALSFFACLKPYADRPVMENGEIPTADAVQKRVQARLAMCGVDGVSFLVSPPAIPGVGVGNDISFALEDLDGQGVGPLYEQAQKLEKALMAHPAIAKASDMMLPRCRRRASPSTRKNAWPRAWITLQPTSCSSASTAPAS